MNPGKLWEVPLLVSAAAIVSCSCPSDVGVCNEFPGAARTKEHKLDDLYEMKFIIS